MDTVALGVCGNRMTEAAMKPEIMNATVIMKLEEFCRRTREECILQEVGLMRGFEYVDVWMEDVGRVICETVWKAKLQIS